MNPSHPTKPTVMEIEERRRKIFSLRMAGATMDKIATAVHVDRSTVSRDLRFMQEQVLVRLQPRSAERMVGDVILKYETILAKAMVEYAGGAQQSIVRVRALEVALQANTLIVKLLQDMGIVKRIPQMIGLAVLDHPAVKDLHQDQRQAIGRGLLRLFTRQGALPPGLEPYVQAMTGTGEQQSDGSDGHPDVVIDPESDNGHPPDHAA